MSVKIYHNPRCSKSRETLALLKDHGVEPEIILYLDDTPNAETLSDIVDLLKVQPRQILRKSEAAYKELELAERDLSDEEIIAAMVSHPKLIERPIVVTSKGARIGRPT